MDNVVPFPEGPDWRPVTDAGRLAHRAILSIICTEDGRLDVEATYREFVGLFSAEPPAT